MSTGSGGIVYARAVVLAALFWRAKRGRSLQDMFDARDREHHRVQKVMNKHSGGSSWRGIQTWTGDQCR